MSRQEADRLVARIVSDSDFLVRLAHLQDDDKLNEVIRAEGFDCTWQETLEVYLHGPRDGDGTTERDRSTETAAGPDDSAPGMT